MDHICPRGLLQRLLQQKLPVVRRAAADGGGHQGMSNAGVAISGTAGSLQSGYTAETCRS